MFSFLVEILFYTFCGWIGATVVKMVGFGRVDLDWGEGSESVLAEWISLFLLIGSILLIAALWQT